MQRSIKLDVVDYIKYLLGLHYVEANRQNKSPDRLNAVGIAHDIASLLGVELKCLATSPHVDIDDLKEELMMIGIKTIVKGISDE